MSLSTFDIGIPNKQHLNKSNNNNGGGNNNNNGGIIENNLFFNDNNLEDEESQLVVSSPSSSFLVSSLNNLLLDKSNNKENKKVTQQQDEEEEEEEDADSSSSTTSSCSSLPLHTIQKHTHPISILNPNKSYQVCNTKKVMATSPALISMFDQPPNNNNNNITSSSSLPNTVCNLEGTEMDVECYSNKSTPQTPTLLSQHRNNNNNHQQQQQEKEKEKEQKIYKSTRNIFINDQPSYFGGDDQDLSSCDENDDECNDNDDDDDDEEMVEVDDDSIPSQLSMSSSQIRKRSISITFPDLNLLSHQVAGQAPLLKLPDGKVLKPLVSTEYQFYLSLDHHPEFINFTPKFYGTIDLKVDYDYLEQTCRSNQKSQLIFDYAHWKNKIIKLPKENQNLYIKIEDLTFSCKYPCILDLKMGTRQHGIDAPTEKIRKMEEKCKMTTSSSLGFRVCGLKVYDQRTGSYTTFDKYYGRSLTDNDMPLVICKFLDNGLRNRSELLPSISKRLSQLIHLFENQQCYKFFGGSLLFIYDGQSINVNDSKLNIKMVDFAHAHPTTLNIDNNNSSNLDEGYLFGLKSLLKIVNTLIQISNSTTNLNTI